jgi:hypothetical protein
MAEKSDKIDFGLAGYILGIVSLVLTLFQPIAAVVLGIIGLIISGKEKTEMGKRGKKYNIIAIIVGVIVFIAYLILATYITNSSLANLPIA